MTDVGPKEVARYTGGLCMTVAAAAGIGWLARMFFGEIAGFVVAVFVVGFAFYAYGLENDGGEPV